MKAINFTSTEEKIKLTKVSCYLEADQIEFIVRDWFKRVHGLELQEADVLFNLGGQMPSIDIMVQVKEKLP